MPGTTTAEASAVTTMCGLPLRMYPVRIASASSEFTRLIGTSNTVTL